MGNTARPIADFGKCMFTPECRSGGELVHRWNPGCWGSRRVLYYPGWQSMAMVVRPFIPIGPMAGLRDILVS